MNYKTSLYNIHVRNIITKGTVSTNTYTKYLIPTHSFIVNNHHVAMLSWKCVVYV